MADGSDQIQFQHDGMRRGRIKVTAAGLSVCETYDEGRLTPL